MDDTVVMFMAPVSGKLKTQQSLQLAQKNKSAAGRLEEVEVAATAQYQINNNLVNGDVF